MSLNSALIYSVTQQKIVNDGLYIFKIFRFKLSQSIFFWGGWVGRGYFQRSLRTFWLFSHLSHIWKMKIKCKNGMTGEQEIVKCDINKWWLVKLLTLSPLLEMLCHKGVEGHIPKLICAWLEVKKKNSSYLGCNFKTTGPFEIFSTVCMNVFYVGLLKWFC